MTDAGSADMGIDSDHGVGHVDSDGTTAHMCGFEFSNGHAGEVTHDAVVVAHSFCGDHSSQSFGVDSSVDMSDHFGHHGMMDAMGASFARAIDPSKSAFGIVVVGHNYINLTEVVRTALTSNKLIELYTPQGDRKRILRTSESILPMRAATRTREAVMPDGYYEGATGITTEWRSFWQLGEQSVTDIIMGRPATLNPRCRWNIDVSITQWYYGESGDYETRIMASIWSGFISKADAKERDAHIKAGQKFIMKMVEALSKTTPSNHARDYRASLKSAGADVVAVDEVVVEAVIEEVA
jgi:hypothetical protein